jgi:cobalt-zinc-cadmium efflux system outer membrane protein
MTAGIPKRTPAQFWLGLLASLVLTAAGCQGPRATMPALVEAQVAGIAPAQATLGFLPCSAVAPPSSAFVPLDLPALWQVAVANNPALREAAAEVEAARGQQVQAGKYPNPHFQFQQDTIGSRTAPPGNLVLQITQEIVTGGKRRLDMAIAGRETDATFLALLGRKYEVLTRLRRAYYAYLGALQAVQQNDDAVAALEKGVATTRKLVETVGIRPRTDLLRLEALLEETKINQARSRFNLAAAWQQVAAEVGVVDLPRPHAASDFNTCSPLWDAATVWQRVKAANTGLRQTAVEAERARLAVERARADALPNITVGGGYTNAAIESTAGAIVSVETALPLWDRKQGHIREAQARWAKAQAVVAMLETSLSATTAEAFARYQGARRQVEHLTKEVEPRLAQSLDLLLKGYEAGGGVAFGDVLMTEQSLIATRLTLAEARQNLWQAVADLEGLMQLDIGEEGTAAPSCSSP